MWMLEHATFVLHRLCKSSQRGLNDHGYSHCLKVKTSLLAHSASKMEYTLSAKNCKSIQMEQEIFAL